MLVAFFLPSFHLLLLLIFFSCFIHVPLFVVCPLHIDHRIALRSLLSSLFPFVQRIGCAFVCCIRCVCFIYIYRSAASPALVELDFYLHLCGAICDDAKTCSFSSSFCSAIILFCKNKFVLFIDYSR